MKTLVILMLNLNFLFGFKFTECKKCDLNQLKFIQENIENLTSDDVESYFCSFDNKCKINSEYSEWNNEVLFKIIENQPNLFLKVLQNQTKEKQSLIFKEIENPVQELNYQILYERIKKTVSNKILKEKVLNSIEKSESKLEK